MAGELLQLWPPLSRKEERWKGPIKRCVSIDHDWQLVGSSWRCKNCAKPSWAAFKGSKVASKRSQCDPERPFALASLARKMGHAVELCRAWSTPFLYCGSCGAYSSWKRDRLLGVCNHSWKVSADARLLRKGRHPRWKCVLDDWGTFATPDACMAPRRTINKRTEPEHVRQRTRCAEAGRQRAKEKELKAEARKLRRKPPASAKELDEAEAAANARSRAAQEQEALRKIELGEALALTRAKASEEAKDRDFRIKLGPLLEFSEDSEDQVCPRCQATVLLSDEQCVCGLSRPSEEDLKAWSDEKEAAAGRLEEPGFTMDVLAAVKGAWHGGTFAPPALYGCITGHEAGRGF